MGGMEGMWLGANAPERFERLVLANTSCHYPDKAFWDERFKAIRSAGGLAPLGDRIMTLWFSPAFRAREPATVARMKDAMVATPVEGYLACAEAVRDMDHRDLLAHIKTPTLVIVGRHDQATTPAAGELVRSGIAGARLVTLDAAHLSNIEQPDQFNSEVLRFLTERAF
jgi:3-oxoadipate enol-lactonase